MDTALQRLIREDYPFPIAHAYKKTLALLDDDARKLKCLIQTAEVTIQFLGLVVLAQLHRDLEHGQAPLLGKRGRQLHDDLRRPGFGRWQGLLRDILKQYGTHRHLLVIPELFDWHFRASRTQKPSPQPVVRQAIEPLMHLRNQFAHPGVPEALVPVRVKEGMHWLEQLLGSLQFLRKYPLAFIPRIEVRRGPGGARRFRHNIIQMVGCSLRVTICP